MNSLKQGINRTLQMEADAIALQIEQLNDAAVQSVFEALLHCKGKIITTGCGTSGTAARKISHTLSCVERPSFFLEPADAVHGGLGAAQPGDVVLLFSKGGQTAELTAMLPALKTKGVTTVAVTENTESQLARQSDYHLRVAIQREPDSFNMLATASIAAVIAVFDALCIELMKAGGFTKQQFATIHPGGAVGKRLLEENPKP